MSAGSKISVRWRLQLHGCRHQAWLRGGLCDCVEGWTTNKRLGALKRLKGLGRATVREAIGGEAEVGVAGVVHG